MEVIKIDPKDKKMINEFINLPYNIYKDNPYWVPPLKRTIKKILLKGDSMQLSGGPYIMFMVKDNNSYLARILVGVNFEKTSKESK